MRLAGTPVPWIVWVGVYVESLPIVVGLLRPSWLTGPRLCIVLWSTVSLGSNLVARWFGARGINNHFITYAITPVQGALMLWALSLWQTRPTAKLTIRIMIPAFIIAWAVLTMTVEDLSNFSAVAEPVYCLLAIGVCVYTLIVRSQETAEPLTRQDWFWICSGFAIVLGMTAFLTPLAAALVRDHPETVIRAYIVRGWVQLAGFILVTIGMLCPPPQTHSGPSS